MGGNIENEIKTKVASVKKRILVIDDDPLVLKSLENLLLREGYLVSCAKNGEQAEASLRSQSADLIISDVRLPGRDGISIVSSLKEIAREMRGEEPPFIFITGYASEEAPIDAIKLGAKDYLLKPFDLDELMKSVRTHIV